MFTKILNWFKPKEMPDINSTKSLLSKVDESDYSVDWVKTDWQLSWNKGTVLLRWSYQQDEDNALWIAALTMFLSTKGLGIEMARDLASNHVFVLSNSYELEVIDRLEDINISVPEALRPVQSVTCDVIKTVRRVLDNPDLCPVDKTSLTNRDMVIAAYKSWDEKKKLETEKPIKKR